MYRVVTKVIIQQLTPYNNIGRSKTLQFDFVNHLECADSWRDLTNDAKLILPKNLYYKNENGKTVPLFDNNINAGGFVDSSPLIMRGDKVTIDWGYRYFRGNKEVFEGTENKLANTHLFEGYISEVGTKKPIEFKCEDNMYLLKQIQVPLKTYSKGTTVESMLQEMLNDTQFTVNTITSTTIGEFKCGNETVAEVLARLRKTYRFESYFRGNELRCGSQVYIPSEAKTYTFEFQNNIISDELRYKRKDDLVLSVVASNTIEENTGATTKDGHTKTKKTRLEVMVTFRNGNEIPIYYVKEKGVDLPQNIGGERLNIPFPQATTIDELKKNALELLKKYYYTGFKGKFTTFGIPFVKMGDNVQLIDQILPERNGLYKVRSVEYEGGVDGLRQTIEIDYLIR